MKIIFFVVVSLTFFKISCAGYYNKFMTNQTINKDLVSAVRFILDEIFFKQYRFFNVIIAANKSDNNELQDFKTAIFEKRKIHDLHYSLRLENHTHFFICPRWKCLDTRINNLFIIDSFESFSTFNKRIGNLRFYVHGQYLIVFPFGRLDDEQNQNIFVTLWNKGFYNVNLMYQDGDEIKMTTFWPFRDGICKSKNESTIDTFKNGSFQHGIVANMFPSGNFCRVFKIFMIL